MKRKRKEALYELAGKERVLYAIKEEGVLHLSVVDNASLGYGYREVLKGLEEKFHQGDSVEEFLTTPIAKELAGELDLRVFLEDYNSKGELILSEGWQFLEDVEDLKGFNSISKAKEYRRKERWLNSAKIF